MSEAEKKQTHFLHFLENRLASFKDWPFDEESACTPEKMAEAGFFHCPTDQEPDLVKCFVCLKELDGWEPTDDPWGEHRSHSAKCPFVKMKDPEAMTVEQLLKLACARYKNITTKEIDKDIAAFEAHCKEAAEELKKELL